MLTAIRTLHTLVWALLARGLVVLPLLAWRGDFRWAAILSVIVLIECGVLVTNGWRCPLTNLAAKYTTDQAPNFDIYLPQWLAKHNKTIFGTLFVANEVFMFLAWLRN
jgi:hypothetical protein